MRHFGFELCSTTLINTWNEYEWSHLSRKLQTKKNLRPTSSLTFTHPGLWDGGRSCAVDRRAAQPQSAVSVRPVLSAAALPLQPGAVGAAAARIPGQRPTPSAALRRGGGTSPGVTRLARTTQGSPRQHQDTEDPQEEHGALAEHDC